MICRAFILFLLFVSLSSYSAIIDYCLSDIGAGKYEYSYYLSDFTPEKNLGFTIYFDYGLYEGITVKSAPCDWDVLTWDPENIFGFEDAGAFDAMALTHNASIEKPFNVCFTWLGDDKGPLEQLFSIYFKDPTSGNILDLESGTTRAVPEPRIIWLFSCGMMLLFFSIIQKKKRGNTF